MENRLILRHRLARQRLTELVDMTPPGKRLPGIRRLSEVAGAKRVVIERELQALAGSGRIRIEPRRGIFKTEQKDPAAVWLLHEGENLLRATGGFDFELFDELQKLAAQSGHRLACAQSTAEQLLQWPEFFRRHHIDSVFLHGFSHEWFRQIVANLCPHVVELLPRHTPAQGFAIADSPDMSAIQLDYLFRLNYRAVGYIHNAEQPREYTIVQHERLNAFYRIMAEHGLRVQPEWVFSGYCTQDIFAARLNKMLNTGVEAVIVAGTFLRKLYQILRANNCEPGRDLGVFCCDDIAASSDPRPATITNSPREIASAAWNLMEAAWRGDPPRIAYTRLRIITGNSLRRQV